MLKVALVHPEIPFNAGNVARTCAAAGAELHLVAPLGFSVSERRLRRAGMDYWERARPRIHESLAAFLSFIKEDAVLAFSAEAPRAHWDAPFAEDSWLVFGCESRGLPQELRARWAERTYRIPMAPGERSLNLSSAAAVVVYEARRRSPGPLA